MNSETETIRILRSETADTRSCDFANVSKETLLESSREHISDVRAGLWLFAGLLAEAANRHDHDKITDIDSFHADFVTGFKQTEWWDRHRRINRHHLLQEDGVPANVNLIDVLDMIADCVMAGMARTGTVYPLEIPTRVLHDAFQNTVELLKAHVVVVARRVDCDAICRDSDYSGGVVRCVGDPGHRGDHGNGHGYNWGDDSKGAVPSTHVKAERAELARSIRHTGPLDETKEGGV